MRFAYRATRSLILLVCLAAGASSARADVVVFGADRDNTLYESPTGALSNGAGSHFFAGQTAGGELRRGLVRFDVAGAIPAGATIHSVSLDLNLSRTVAGTVDVDLHRVLADWGEAASNAGGNEGGGTAAGPGDATWLHTFHNASFWTVVGGDFAAGASATFSAGLEGPYSVGGSGMVADVQAWRDDPSTNHGWILIGDESGDPSSKRFDSRDNTTAANRPQLTVDFTPPVLDGACCRGGGLCFSVEESACLAQGGAFQGAGVPCTPDPCTGGSGGCCFDDGSCSETGAGPCFVAGGTYQGDGTTCSPNTCPQPMGACCAADATCTMDTPVDCASGGGDYGGDGSDCASAACPLLLEPYVDALPIPTVAQPVSGTAGGAATYDIAMSEFQQQVHRDLPPTTFWGYGDAAGPSFPGPTIETSANQTVTVNWINDLRESATGALRTDHFLPVAGTDPPGCIHGAQDLPKTVVHLHGAHVEAAFDGYPEFTYLPGNQDTYVYPNDQLPAALWYHDHALGITRLNVYMGLAGFWLIRDNFEQLFLDLPDAAYEIPLMLADRTFAGDGSLVYPAAWQDHFFGDKILVNGKVWPFLEVDRGKYRFRLLNGSGSRTYTLNLSGGMTFERIGSDGGLLNGPLTMAEITLGPAERADVVIDFESLAPGTEIFMTNSAPAPYPGAPGVGVVPEVMKFVVTAQTGHTNPVPTSLRAVGPLPEAQAVAHRDFELLASPDPCTGTAWTINGLGWDDIVEYPELDTIEVWRFINRSGVAHPMHMHLVMFQVIDRQSFDIVDGEIVPTGSPVFRPAHEGGWKDTAMAYPGEITRVIARFEDYTGKFAYHCHILEHEDQEMMRQFQTVACGNAETEPTEACDDGNDLLGDGCSDRCEREERVELVGTAQGGSVRLVVDGVTIQIVTTPGQTAEQVAAALVDAIHADPTLAAAGIRAIARGAEVIADAPITEVSIDDTGLDDRLMLVLLPDRLWWADVESATGYDLVAGDLGALRAAGGAFASAGTACLDAGRTDNVYDAADAPAAGEARWYLVREEIAGVNGSWNTGAPSQVADRDAGIAASGGDCP